MSPQSSKSLTQVPAGALKSTWSPAGTKPGAGRKGGLRPSASDGLLQGAGASALGMRSSGTLPRRQKEETWAAFAVNAPAGEQQLLKGTASARKAPAPSACNDF